MEFTSLYVWKPSKSLEEIKERITKLESSKKEGESIQHAVPYTFLAAITSVFPEVTFGLTSMNSVQEKAFTHNIAATLLHDVGAKFVLLGTSQSRKTSNFDPTTLTLQITKASALQVIPRLCIGENYHQYSSQQSKEVLSTQLQAALKNLNSPTLLEIIYEAPWMDEAPSTPSPESINAAYQLCRTTLEEVFPHIPLKIFCKIPNEVSDIHLIPADGFYFLNN